MGFHDGFFSPLNVHPVDKSIKPFYAYENHYIFLFICNVQMKQSLKLRHVHRYTKIKRQGVGRK